MENKKSKFAPLFDPNKPNVTKMLEPHSGLLFWDEHLKVYYKQYRKLTGQFWVPQEVSLQSDSTDWNNALTDDQKEFFKRAISQLVLLDSLATLADGSMANYIQNTAVRTLLFYIASQESIHNESYTYICTSFMTKEEADEVFTKPKKDPLVINATQPILDAFDEFRNNPSPTTLAYSLAAMSALEGIRFTNGFTPFYYLNRNRLMQGTGSIINLINRDEGQHSYTQIAILRDLLTQYSYSDPKVKSYVSRKEVIAKQIEDLENMKDEYDRYYETSFNEHLEEEFDYKEDYLNFAKKVSKIIPEIVEGYNEDDVPLLNLDKSYEEIMASKIEEQKNIDEYIENNVIDSKALEEKIYELFRHVVKGEQELVNSMYKDFHDIDVIEVHMYVEWRANMLLANMGLDKIFETKRNPMKWISIYDPENKNNQKTDFFEKRETNYAKSDVSKNKWDEL